MGKLNRITDKSAHEEASRFVDWQEVGTGGSSAVYKVTDNDLGTTLAIKILRQELWNDARHIESLRREVLISRQLRHPNICPIHDLYEGERGIGIVMDLIEGYDLKQWMRANRDALLETMPARLDLLRKLAQALVVAHSLIVHRDLKPANIFLRKGDVRDPVIMDFGLSTPDSADRSHELDGGTPKYMAPEQFLRKPTDHGADIFSFGMLTYELLSGGQIPPSSLKDAYKTGELPRFKAEDILPPSTFCAAISPELDRLVLAMIEHDPGKRPASAEEVTAALVAAKLLDPFRPLIAHGSANSGIDVPAALYLVGDKTGRPQEQPAKRIRLSHFRISPTPVTNTDYRRFLSATGYAAPRFIDHALFGRDLHPVVMVSWADAAAYARWAGGRLPTELEWEVAAKSGNPSNVYPWGSREIRTIDANIDNRTDSTTPVGSYVSGATAWGLSDCCGNVWEWCADNWDEELLKKLVADATPAAPHANGTLKSVRGGSFDAPAVTGRTTFRHHFQAAERRADLGFRIVYGVQ